MKMRWFDRVLISLGGLALAAVGVCAVLAGGGVIKPERFALDVWFGSGWQWMPVVVLAGLIVVAWGVWLFLLPLLRQRARGGKYYTVQGATDEDGVHISMQALDHLVHRALSVWPEILAANVKIGGQEDAMHITLRTTLQSNVRIPDLIGDVRAEIKQYVEECAGVKVASVKVIVEATKDARAQQKDIKANLLDEPEPVNEPPQAAEPKPVPTDVPLYLKREPVQNEAVSEPPEVIAPEDNESEFWIDTDTEPSKPLPVTLSGEAFPFPEAIQADSQTPDHSSEASDKADETEHAEEEAPDA